MKRVSNGRFTKETLKILSIIRPIKTSTIWRAYQQISIDDTESVQKQFVIHLLDNRKKATSYRLVPSYSDRCEILNILPLEARWHSMFFMVKCMIAF